MHVIEVNEIECLLSYRDEWTRLLAVTPKARFFQTLEWLEIYWRHFGGDQRLRTLVVCDDGHIVGVLPLAVKNTATRGGTVRTLGYPLDGWGTSYGPIGGNGPIVLAAGLEHLQRTPRDWDILELDWTLGDQIEAILEAFQPVRVRPQLFARDDISLINLAQPWDHYWSGLHSKHRNNIRRAERKLAGIGAIETLHYRSSGANQGNARWDLYSQCETVSRKSWQGTSTTGNTLTHERVRPFLRDVHELAARMGAVSLHLLTVDGEPGAFSYNYAFRGTEFGLCMAYDRKFKTGHAGTVLMHRMLQDAFASPHSLMDLGEGDSRYKHAWRTQAVASVRVCHYASTSLRGQTLRWMRRLSKSLLTIDPPSSVSG